MNGNTTNLPNNIIRIPRPKGATLLAIQADKPGVRDKVITAFLQGTFPFECKTLNMYQFAELYNIPIQTVQRRIKDGLAGNLLDDGDLALTLEKERLRSFSQVLYRIGVSDLDTDRLTAHLSSAIYSSSRLSPDLIKELNSVIGNKIKLNETQLKTIVLMNQAMAALLEHPPRTDEAILTREEILQQLNQAGINTKGLEKEIEGTPDLQPHNLSAARAAKGLNKDASHEYKTLKEQKLIPAITTQVVPPS